MSSRAQGASLRRAQVSLNTVDNVEGFLADVRGGRWDVVLPQVALLRLPRGKLEDLYEHVFLARIRSLCAPSALAQATCHRSWWS